MFSARDLLGQVMQVGMTDTTANRMRHAIGPGGLCTSHEVTLRLDRVSADDVAAEAGRLGFHAEPHRLVPETEEYLGSTVMVLRAP